jgi:hypothetical protein
LSSGGLGIIDPKAQSKALLAELLVRGLAPRGETWKEILKHQTYQVHLPMHGKGSRILNINWLFAAPKFKQMKRAFWKSILGSWFNVKIGLAKFKPASHAEVLRQPIFNNPHTLNTIGRPLECVVVVKDAPLPILAAPESKIFGTWRAGHGKASKPFG